MEEVRKTAQSYYKSSSPKIKELAHDFFKALDSDGDEKVSLHEFLTFMKKQGYPKMGNPYFFNELDKDGNKALGFMEVMALYYIIKSGRPFCEGCGAFIPGMFWTCQRCFKNGDESFCLCSACFDSGCYIHEHNYFIDNYALLENEREKAVARRRAAAHQEPSSSVTITELPATSTSTELPATSTSTEMVPYTEGVNPWIVVVYVAFKAVEVALNVASRCSIM